MSRTVTIMVSNATGKMARSRYVELLNDLEQLIKTSPELVRIHGRGYADALNPPFASYVIEVADPGPVVARVRLLCRRYKYADECVATVVGQLQRAVAA